MGFGGDYLWGTHVADGVGVVKIPSVCADIITAVVYEFILQIKHLVGIVYTHNT